MTVTDLSRTDLEPTTESVRLAELNRQIEQTTSALLDPQGWRDELSAKLAELKASRAEVLALVAGAALEA